jgi:hypothetical protein
MRIGSPRELQDQDRVWCLPAGAAVLTRAADPGDLLAA